MKIRNRFFAFSLLLTAILLIFMAGCSSGGTDFKDITVENIGDRVQANLPNLNSYEMDMEMTMDMEGVVEDESASAIMSITANGATDLAAKKAAVDMTMSVKGKSGSENIDENAKMSTYIIENISYIGESSGDEKMSWHQETVSSSQWEELQQTQQLMSLLENSEIKSLKTETVQGIRCFLVELTSDPTLIWDMILNQTGESSDGLDITGNGDTVKSASVKYWVTQDTLFIKKIYLYLDVEISAATLGANSGQLRYIIETNQYFSKHNQSVEIQLPPEATES